MNADIGSVRPSADEGAGVAEADASPATDVTSVFPGGGEMAARCRALDWAVTPLGPVGTWPQSLRTAVALTLASGFPSVLVWGPERVQLYNDAYVPLIGTKHPAALGRPTHESWPELREQQERIFARVYAGETVTLADAPYRLDRSGLPEDAYFDATFVPVPLASGEIGGSLSTLFETTAKVAARTFEAERDRLLVSEREARAEAEGARAAAEVERVRAESASRAKSEFLATMSHELRTPLNAIVGYAQLVELGVAGPVTERQRAYLTRLAATSEHLRGLVDDVLDLAKIDAGGMRVVRELGLTGALVAAALDLVRPQASERGVRLENGCQGGPGEPFVGDEHRVRQILANLLSNAVKFTAAGGTVAVTCGCESATPAATHLRGAGPWTFIRVTDTGIGIAPEQQARLFAPFHQVDGQHTRTAGGTGLGLAISRRLARLMGGDLTVESMPGVGSSFTLWLPAASATGGAGGEAESAAERGARARQEPGAGRVQGLAETGVRLRERLEEVLAAYAARLRADPAFPQALHLRRSEVEDHQHSFLADVAQTLVVIEEAGGPESELLRDGSTILRVIAELHGAMRRRRGWTEAQLEREYTILWEEIAGVVRRGSANGSGDATLALGVLEQLIARARVIGVAALRRSAEMEDAADG